MIPEATIYISETSWADRALPSPFSGRVPHGYLASEGHITLPSWFRTLVIS
jgi:hypothetical protein